MDYLHQAHLKVTDAVIQRICSQGSSPEAYREEFVLSWFATHPLQLLCPLLQILYLPLLYWGPYSNSVAWDLKFVSLFF